MTKDDERSTEELMKRYCKRVQTKMYLTTLVIGLILSATLHPIFFMLSLLMCYALLYYAKSIRRRFPSRSQLVFFLITAGILQLFFMSFFYICIILGLMLFVPEKAWSLLAEHKKQRLIKKSNK